MNNHFPKFALRLLLPFLDKEKNYGFWGDIEEIYDARVLACGSVKANIWLMNQILKCVPEIMSNQTIRSGMMLKNYLKVSVRSILRNKGYSFINIFGLGISLPVCLLVILFIVEQKSFDKHNPYNDRIFRVITDVTNGETNYTRHQATTPAPLAAEIAEKYAGIEDVITLRRFSATGRNADNIFDITGLYAESGFFDFFAFALESGDPATALASPGSIVLTHEVVEKFFGSENPVGKTILIDNEAEYTVTGILKEPLPNSHLGFEVLVSFTTLQTDNKEVKILNKWAESTSSFYTYLRLGPSVSDLDIASGLPAIRDEHYADIQNVTYNFALQPLTGINLGPQLGDPIGPFIPDFIAYFLAIVSLIIILSAGLNYVGMSIARSLKRAKEIGIRKVAGAFRRQIITQFLFESGLIVFTALCVGFIILLWLVPQFNGLLLIQELNGEILLDFTKDGNVYLIFLLFAASVALLSGLYPAIYLSSFKPVKAVKGFVRTRRFSVFNLRKVILFTQFVFSIVFIISAIAVYQFARWQIGVDFGFNREHIVNIELQNVPYSVLRNELSKNPNITGISAASSIMGAGGQRPIDVKSKGMEESTRGYSSAIDFDFIENLELHIIAGRELSSEYKDDLNGRSIIINETAVEKLGLGTPLEAVGTILSVDKNNDRHVVGVVKDFQYDYLWEEMLPLVLSYDENRFAFLNARIQPGSAPDLVKSLNAVWNSVDGTTALKYRFHDEEIYTIYVSGYDLADLIGFVAVLAVAIALLGLLSMAAYDASVRKKEIGIRKVLGGGVPGLVYVLSGSFAKLMILASIVAIPIAWFGNNLWLNGLRSGVTVNAGTVALSLLFIYVFSLVTICSQTVKAALANPAKTLKFE